MPDKSPPLILASSSPYRYALLKRLELEFETIAPEIDESQAPEESPDVLVRRLARNKAEKVQTRYPDAIIIGSDQLATLVHGDKAEIIGKPGTDTAAIEQLQAFSDQAVIFHTTVCVCWPDGCLIEDVPTEVHFRELSASQIETYVKRENATDCAGGFKAEGLGITLFRKISSDDPTALLGLPMIATARMLRAAGLDPLKGDS